MRICDIKGCINKHHGNGLCNKHRKQLKRHGKILTRTKYDPNEILIKGNVAEIVLYNYKCQEKARAIIDLADLWKVKKYKWYTSTKNGKHYVVTQINRKPFYLHSLILGDIFKGEEADHKDQNPLNNRRYNLRGATHQENRWNTPKFINNTSGYKGVIANGKESWMAMLGGLYLGTYRDKKDAAMAYNKKALELHGEFACLNPI